MSKERKFQCNEGCGEAFELSDFSRANLDGGIEKTYFACTHCNKEYVVYYTDEAVRRLQQQQENEKNRHAVLINAGDLDGAKRADKRFRNRSKTIEREMNRVRASVEGGL